MKSMNRNRIVAILATITLLVGSLAVGGVLTASAVSDGWTADDSGNGQYKTFAQYDNAYLANLGTSLVQGVVPYRKASSDATPWTLSGTWSGYQHQNYAEDNVLNITDGAIRSSSADTTTDKFTSKHRATTSTWLFIFDLGEMYDLTDFVLASSQNDTANYLLRNARIYVSDNLDTPISDDKLVYSRWDAAADANARNFHVQPTNGQAVTGRYVSFEILHTGDNYIRIEELAVYGTKHIDWIPGDTVGESAVGRYTTFAQYDNAYLAGLGTSLVEDVVPYRKASSDATPWTLSGTWSGYQHPNYTAENVLNITDGAIRSSSADTTTDKFTSKHRGTTSTWFFIFDLGDRYDLTDFVLASSQNDGANYVLRNARIYVSDDLDTPVSSDKLVYSRWGAAADANARNFHVQPTNGQAVTGRYVSFEILHTGDNYIRIEELAVYGTEAVEEEPVGVVKSLGGQVATYADNDTVAKLRLGFDAAVTGVTRNESYEGDYTAAKVTVNGTTYDIAVDEETNLPIIGALVARGTKASSEDLVVDGQNGEVKDVHAKKIYDVNDDSITFTALITNVPSDYFGEQIIGRAYVAYVDGDTVRYVYSDLLSRSVNDVKNNTEMQ